MRLFPGALHGADQGARPQLLEVCQGEVEGAFDGALDGDAVGGRVEVGDGEVAADVEGWGGGDLWPQPSMEDSALKGAGLTTTRSESECSGLMPYMVRLWRVA